MAPKTKLTPDDYYFFATAESVFAMLRPIENRLRAGGYTGDIIADFNTAIYTQNMGIEKEAPYDFNTMMFNAKVENGGFLHYDTGGFSFAESLTEEGAEEFYKTLKRYEKYINLLIKNTPPEEYPDELAEMKYHQAYIRMINVFGSREPWMDQIGFLPNARGYDADLMGMNELTDQKHLSRELWRQVKQNYPYTEYRDAIVNITNIYCDYEENKEKYSYAEHLDYLQNYKKYLKDYLSACKSLEIGDKEHERISKLYIRDSVIEDLKNEDGADKNVDYYAIIKRVEEQENNGQEVDPEDKRIAKDIQSRVDDQYIKDYFKTDEYNSRYTRELAAMGYETNEKDFTGARGNGNFYNELEAQINAIDNGWPADELVHIQRLQTILRGSTIVLREHQDTPERVSFQAKCRVFYNDKIKDKPYPTTEEGRQALYQEFYALGQEASELIGGTYNSRVEQGGLVNLKWDVFKDDIKKSMDKPLTYTQKMVQKHMQEGANQELTLAGINAIRFDINTRKKAGHSDSAEFERLQNAVNRFAEAYDNNRDAFKVPQGQLLGQEALRILKEVKEASRAYIKEKDKEDKNPENRSNMGKNRYEGAIKAYNLVSHLIRKNDELIESRARAKKEAERIKNRKEMREAFFKTGTDEAKNYREFEIKKAGSEERYNARIEEEARRDAEEKNREPVTDDEKYEKLINSCRVKKDDPAVYPNPEQNDAIQNQRIDKLAKMLAADELQKAGKAFNLDDIESRSKELKNLYSLSALKRVTDNFNGPEELKNALTFKFRAVEFRKKLEEPLYEVGKTKYKTTYESMNKFQHDLAEILNKNQKHSADISARTLKIVNVLNEIMDINLKDKTLVVLNSYKLRKANVKLMQAIHNAFDGMNSFSRDALGPRLALDTLAVLTTYTGCKAVTNKFLNKVNSKTDLEGNMHNINTDTFTSDFGVKHSKSVSNKVRENANRVNNLAHPANPAL